MRVVNFDRGDLARSHDIVYFDVRHPGSIQPHDWPASPESDNVSAHRGPDAYAGNSTKRVADERRSATRNLTLLQKPASAAVLLPLIKLRQSGIALIDDDLIKPLDNPFETDVDWRGGAGGDFDLTRSETHMSHNKNGVNGLRMLKDKSTIPVGPRQPGLRRAVDELQLRIRQWSPARANRPA